MDMNLFNFIITLLIISGISMGALGLYGRKFSSRIPAGVPYSLLMFLCSAWCILYAIQLLAGLLPLGLSWQIIYHNLRFLFLPFIPLVELWLVIVFIQRNEWLRKEWIAAALIIPAVAVVLAITTPLHTLFRYNFRLVTTGPLPVLEYTDSLFYVIYNTYLLLILIIAMLILIIEGRKRGTLYGKQSLLLLAAILFPTVVNYLFVYGITPIPGVNMTAALLWVPAILYTIALFRYRFLDIVPVARNRLIEIMNTPVIVLDNDRRIVDLNPAAATFFSVTADSVPGEEVEKVIPDWPEFTELCHEQGTCRYNLTRGTGFSARFFMGSAEPLLNSAGEMEGRLILLQDITDLKTRERELRESERKFALAFRSSPYAIIITRMSDGMILDANDGFHQISGYALTDVIGKPVPGLNIWLDPADRESVMQDLRTGDRVAGREFRFRTRSGRIITGLLSAETIMIRGDTYLLWSINDITDRKQAEEERERVIRELSQKNAELDRFTHTVSHDLKSPLLTIQGFIELLKEDIRKNDTAQMDADIDRIATAARKMDLLIATLLELSRSGRRVDTPVRIAFADLVREAAGLLAIPLHNNNVTLVIADNLPEVSGDRQRLLQVMTNLLDNAAKFMGDQKEPRVEVGVRTEAGTPVFFVRDNGMGIKKENLLNVFGLFERFNPDIPGSGIGLSTVKRIIEAHGGRIWAESEGEGKGTTMCFTLPGVLPARDPGPEAAG